MRQQILQILTISLILASTQAQKDTAKKPKIVLKSIDEFRIKAPLDTKSNH